MTIVLNVSKKIVYGILDKAKATPQKKFASSEEEKWHKRFILVSTPSLYRHQTDAKGKILYLHNDEQALSILYLISNKNYFRLNLNTNPQFEGKRFIYRHYYAKEYLRLRREIADEIDKRKQAKEDLLYEEHEGVDFF